MASFITILRKGEFSIREAQHSEFGCGVPYETLDYKYEVEITAQAGRLKEPEHFVIDNKEIDDYFQSEYGDGDKRMESCEHVVEDAIEHFRSLFRWGAKYQGVRVTKIVVVLRGTEVSGCRGEWSK